MTSQERQNKFIEGLNTLRQQYGVVLVGSIEHEQANLPGGFTEASRIVITPMLDPNWQQEAVEAQIPALQAD